MACLAGTTWQSDLRHIAYLYAPVQLPFLMLIILVHTLEYGIKKCPDCIAWVWDIFRIFCHLLGYVLTCRWIHFMPGGLRLSRLLCLRASLLTPVCSLHQCRAPRYSKLLVGSFVFFSVTRAGFRNCIRQKKNPSAVPLQPHHTRYLSRGLVRTHSRGNKRVHYM